MPGRRAWRVSRRPGVRSGTPSRSWSKIRPDSPSKNLITTLPRTASQTTTSATCAVRSLPSTLPMELGIRLVDELGGALDPGVALALLLADRQQGDAGPVDSQDTLAEDRAHLRVLRKVLGVEIRVGPDVGRTNGRSVPTIWIASPGRSTPRRRPRRRTAAAIPAPVWPAVTTASASPRFTSSVATRIDASFFSRSAMAGCSCISMTCDACRVCTLAGRSSRYGAITASSPTRMSGVLGMGAAHASAPGITSLGPWSPPTASTATRTPVRAGACRCGIAGRGHDPVSRTLARGRTAGRLQLDRLAAVVPPACRADPVRQLGLVAVRALDELRQGEREVLAPALRLSRVSDLSLRHTHGGTCSLCSW